MPGLIGRLSHPSHPSSTLSDVLIDPSQFEQVITELVVNAREAMPDGGTLRVQTEDEPWSPALLHLEEGQSDHCLHLSFLDTGIGMSDQVKAHLFEPFFPNKGKAAGKGLGLSTVYGIIRQSGGHISVNSEPGKGSRFDIYLPLSRAACASQPSSQLTVSRPDGSGTILIVEDEEALQKLDVAPIGEGGIPRLRGLEWRGSAAPCRSNARATRAAHYGRDYAAGHWARISGKPSSALAGLARHLRFRLLGRRNLQAGRSSARRGAPPEAIRSAATPQSRSRNSGRCARQIND